MNEHLYKKVITAFNSCMDEGEGCEDCPYKNGIYTCKHTQLIKDAVTVLEKMHSIVSLADRFPIPGKRDKRGAQIHNGDILYFQDEDAGEEYLLVYYNEGLAGFFGRSDRSRFPVDLEITQDLKVIGNRFDNPELLAKFSPLEK